MKKRFLVIGIVIILLFIGLNGCLEYPITIEGTLINEYFPPINESVPTCKALAVQKNNYTFFLTENRYPLCSLIDYGDFEINDDVIVRGIYHKLTKFDDSTVKYYAIDIEEIEKRDIE